MAASTASCEWSFSKLKLILSYFQVSIGHDRLCYLALSREIEDKEKTDFDDIMGESASTKSQKVLFYLAFLCYLSRKTLDKLFLWNCLSNISNTWLVFKTYCTI